MFIWHSISDLQMTQNNDIAYTSWDYNSLTTLLFVKQLVQANIKENTKPTFCEGNPPVMESPHTEPLKLHSSDPSRRESTDDKWFHFTHGQWCHQLRNDKLYNSNILLVS